MSDTFNPGDLLDALISHLRLKNDAALALELEVAPPVISKMRHNTMPVGATMLLRMHEISDIPIKQLRALMDDHRDKFRSAHYTDR